MDAKTQKSELTRAAIVGAAMDLALAEGVLTASEGEDEANELTQAA